jgi:hypothetical protein
MTHTRQQETWNHTASLLAMLANVNREPKKGRAFKPADFHPMPTPTKAQRAEAPPLKGDIGMLKTVFVDNAPVRR